MRIHPFHLDDFAIERDLLGLVELSETKIALLAVAPAEALRYLRRDGPAVKATMKEG